MVLRPHRCRVSGYKPSPTAEHLVTITCTIPIVLNYFPGKLCTSKRFCKVLGAGTWDDKTTNCIGFLGICQRSNWKRCEWGMAEPALFAISRISEQRGDPTSGAKRHYTTLSSAALPSDPTSDTARPSVSTTSAIIPRDNSNNYVTSYYVFIEKQRDTLQQQHASQQHYLDHHQMLSLG